MGNELTQPDTIPTNVVPLDPTTAMLTSWGFGGLIKPYVTSIDESTLEGAELVFRCLQSKTESGRANIGIQLSATGYLLGPVEFPDRETGEIQRTILTRFILADGRILATHSYTVAAGLLHYATRVRPAPWQPPLLFQLKEIESKPPRRYMVFEPVFERLTSTVPQPKHKRQP